MGKLKYRDINTKRLLLRAPKPSDNVYQFNYMSNPKNFEFADYKIAKTKTDIEEFFKSMWRDHLKTSLFWMICDKNTDQPIGTLSAWNVDYEANSIEFGYSIYPKYREKGYMYEVLTKVVDFCYKELEFTVFDIWTDKANKPSIDLAIKLGFEFKGFVDEPAKNSNTIITYATYQLKK
ncbi:GNAT family N-acetyltransferase [Mycoplasmatota bacterium WC30]